MRIILTNSVLIKLIIYDLVVLIQLPVAEDVCKERMWLVGDGLVQNQ